MNLASQEADARDPNENYRFHPSSAGIKPNSNVYVELGSTWRFLMREPTSAAHALRQADQVLRGKQCALGHRLDLVRLTAGPDPGVSHFQIAPELRAMYGYSEITPAVRARIFGLNAARVYSINPDEVKKHTRADRIAEERFDYSERPEPHFLTYGPKTRREFLNLLPWNGGSRA